MLIDSVKRRLIERSNQLKSQGGLTEPEKLDQYYSAFRSRFGPERLAALDGEALLETMHAHGSKESLVYWLEFKNDDEFPSPDFGSIAGGSALKFGVFRSSQTGKWQVANNKNQPVEVSVADAISIARKHRDQLLVGVEALRQIPPDAPDAEYRLLQETLDNVAPKVSSLAWGHKYFHLLFPDRLDDFHNPELQRFHILKLLQLPPEGEGRYLCAGRFVSAARELNLPMGNLTATLNALHGRQHRYWRISAGAGAMTQNRWGLMKDAGCVAFGWESLGDLSWVEAKKESRARLQKILEEDRSIAPEEIGRSRVQIINFVAEMTKGDMVIATDGSSVKGIGRIMGDHFCEPSAEFPNRRNVEWLSFDEWQVPNPQELGPATCELYEFRKQPTTLLEIETRAQNAVHTQTPLPVTHAVSSRHRIAELDGIPGQIQRALERKSQVILFGPPGTGKTYWAEKAACELAAQWNFGGSFDSLDDTKKQAVQGTSLTSGFVRLCCFHPAYGYEDFIEGYRPEIVNNQPTFKLRDGLFKQLCSDANNEPDQRFFLIVDEINRGDIPRIFGELLTLLEKDKRGRHISLPVSQKAFRVPHNVYLIGTMNTADRSISLLDAALRRRFGFIELMPDNSLFQSHFVGEIPLGPWFDALNQRICKNVSRDSRNLQLGHSYLLDGGHPVKDFAAFKRALQFEIIPLLEEYCYEDITALEEILGSGLVDKLKKRIKQELFGDGKEVELMGALRQPCPDIFTSNEAFPSNADSETSDNSDLDGDQR